MIKFAYELIANNVPCKILGKDISNDIVSFINKFKCVSVGELLDKIKKISFEEKDGKPSVSSDRVELVNVFYENLTKTGIK